jgi:putative transposase
LSKEHAGEEVKIRLGVNCCSLKEAETGIAVSEVILRVGFRAHILRLEEAVRWSGCRELRRLKQLEDENRKLEQLVVGLSLGLHILQDMQARSKRAAAL